jgi:hypothetical protein
VPATDVSAWVTDQVQLSLTRWVVESAVWDLGQLSGLLGQGTTPDLESRWFRQTYGLMVGLAAALAPLFLVLGALQALARQDPGVVARALVNLALAFLAAALAVPIAALLLRITDNLSAYLVAAELDHLNRFLDGVSAGLGQDLGGGPAQNPGVPPLFMVFCAGDLICLGCMLIWLELLVREAATYVAVLFFPLLLAAAVWPRAMQLVRQLTEMLVAVILSKLAIVVVVVGGGAALVDAFEHRSLGGLLVGGAVLLLAAYAPYKLLRMLPVVEVAATHVFDGGSRRGLGALQAGASHAYGLRGLARPAQAAAAGGAAPAAAGLAATLMMAAGWRSARGRGTTGDEV